MKFSKNISYIMLTLGVASVSTSCLKDKANETSPGAGSTNNVVEFMNSSVPVSYSAIWPQYDNTVVFPSGGDTAGFNMNLDYTGAVATTPQDITVNLAIDTAALTAFNNDQGTNYVLPPADVFSIPSSVVIKAGTEKTITRLTVTAAADYDYLASYALPITITSASYGIVSTNFGTAIYSFTMNNIYSDTYAITGFWFTDSASSAGAISQSYFLPTTGLVTNSFMIPADNGATYTFNANTPATGGALTSYVATNGTPVAPASGFMTKDNPGNFSFPAVSPVAPGSNGWVASKYNNTYDATNKIYWLLVGLNEGTGNTAGQNNWNNQSYMEMVAQ